MKQAKPKTFRVGELVIVDRTGRATQADIEEMVDALRREAKQATQRSKP